MLFAGLYDYANLEGCLRAGRSGSVLMRLQDPKAPCGLSALLLPLPARTLNGCTTDNP